MTDRKPGKTYKIPLDQLRIDPQNANTHSDKSVQAIADSFESFGQQRPIIASPKGTVIAGNGQLLAARKLGWSSMDVRITDLKGKAARAFAIADNRIPELSTFDTETLDKQLQELHQAGWDKDLSLGWSEDEIIAMLTAPEPGLDSEPQWENIPEAESAAEDSENRPDGDAAKDSSESSHATIVLTREQYDIVMRSVHQLRLDEQTMDITVGRALELICADFIGG
jgi:hypothetical protein